MARPSACSVSLTVCSSPAGERTVTGVVADVPANSHFTFTFLLPLAAEPDSLRYDWVRSQFYTYLLLDAHTSPDEVLAQVPAVLISRLGSDAAAFFDVLGVIAGQQE